MHRLKVIGRRTVLFTEEGAVFGSLKLGKVFNVKRFRKYTAFFNTKGVVLVGKGWVKGIPCPGVIDCSSEGCAYRTGRSIYVEGDGFSYGVPLKPLFLIPYSDAPVPFLGQLWGRRFVSYRVYPEGEDWGPPTFFAPHRFSYALPTLHPDCLARGVVSCKQGATLYIGKVKVGDAVYRVSGEFVDVAQAERGVLLYGNEEKVLPIKAGISEPVEEEMFRPDPSLCSQSEESVDVVGQVLAVLKSRILKLLYS